MTRQLVETSREVGAPLQTPRNAAFGYITVVVGILVALWVGVGRSFFGIGGELTWIYVVTLAVLIATLQFFIGRALIRAARRGRRSRPATIAMTCVSWGTGILLGLTIPDLTPQGLQTIVSGAVEPGLGIAVGIANPLGIVCVVTAIWALVLANLDLKDRPVVDED